MSITFKQASKSFKPFFFLKLLTRRAPTCKQNICLLLSGPSRIPGSISKNDHQVLR